MVRERNIEKYLKTNIERFGGKCLKFHSANINGVPDRILVLPGGVTKYVEVKKPGEDLRPLQLKMKSMFKKIGHEVEVVSTFEEVDELMKKLSEVIDHGD